MRSEAFGVTTDIGYWIPPLHEIVRDPVCGTFLRSGLTAFFKGLSVGDDAVGTCVDRFLAEAEQRGDPLRRENRLSSLIDEMVPGEARERAVGKRTRRIVEQLRAVIRDEPVLDVGCGDASVVASLQSGSIRAYGYDLLRSLGGLRGGLCLVASSPAAIRNSSCGTVVVATVLHHTNEASRIVSECARVVRPGGRILVLESVVGVDRQGGTDTDAAFDLDLAETYIALGDRQAWASAFFDYLYNRLLCFSESLDQKVPVPFNFRSTAHWTHELESVGCCVTAIVDLGFDQPLNCLYHSLLVAER